MTVHVADHGAVRLLVLDRPEVLNAFDSPQYDLLSQRLADASDDDGM